MMPVGVTDMTSVVAGKLTIMLKVTKVREGQDRNRDQVVIFV